MPRASAAECQEQHPDQQVDQEDIQAQDHADHEGGERGRRLLVDQRPHEAAIAAEQKQRDEGERDSERQHDLAEHQGPRGVEADRDHDERRCHGDGPAQEQRNAALDEPLHHDLAGQRAH